MSGDDWTVYILLCGDGSFYTGIARDVHARLMQHQQGKGARYTRGRGPLELVYTEWADDRSSAQKREAEIKAFSRPEKQQLINLKTDGGIRR